MGQIFVNLEHKVRVIRGKEVRKKECNLERYEFG